MTKNNLLSEKLNYTGISQTPTHLHLCSYNPEGVHDCNGKDIDEIIPHLQPNSINWIQIHGLQNTETVQKSANTSVSTFGHTRYSECRSPDQNRRT